MSETHMQLPNNFCFGDILKPDAMKNYTDTQVCEMLYLMGLELVNTEGMAVFHSGYSEVSSVILEELQARNIKWRKVFNIALDRFEMEVLRLRLDPSPEIDFEAKRRLAYSMLIIVKDYSHEYLVNFVEFLHEPEYANIKQTIEAWLAQEEKENLNEKTPVRSVNSKLGKSGKLGMVEL